ncbi:hypothetical protein GCM10027565_51850 [Bordetella tumulicola]
MDLPHSIQSLGEDQHRAIAATLRYISDNFESGFGPLDKAKYALDLYGSRYLD